MGFNPMKGDRYLSSTAGSLVASSSVPALLLMGAHLSIIVVQVVGSLWIKRLSPELLPIGVSRN